MKVACLIFVNAIVLVNMIAGIRQALKLGRLRIGTCCGVITRSGIGQREELHRSKKIQMLSPQVEYTYEVSGHPMKGDAISFLAVRSSKPSAALKRLSSYPVGAQVEVFFNIDQPEQSYLINPKKHIWTTLGVMVIFVLFGGLMNFMILQLLE
jgi:hypothetical protein